MLGTCRAPLLPHGASAIILITAGLRSRRKRLEMAVFSGAARAQRSPARPRLSTAQGTGPYESGGSGSRQKRRAPILALMPDMRLFRPQARGRYRPGVKKNRRKIPPRGKEIDAQAPGKAQNAAFGPAMPARTTGASTRWFSDINFTSGNPGAESGRNKADAERNEPTRTEEDDGGLGVRE